MVSRDFIPKKSCVCGTHSVFWRNLWHCFIFDFSMSFYITFKRKLWHVGHKWVICGSHPDCSVGQQVWSMATFNPDVLWLHNYKLIQYSYVTGFVKRGLMHAPNFLTLRMCNATSLWPIALKFGSNTFLSLNRYEGIIQCTSLFTNKVSYISSKLQNQLCV